MSTQDVFAGEDLHVDFACIRNDGTPLDLTSGGSAEFRFWRNGFHPVNISISTESPGFGAWVNRAQGTGFFVMPLQLVPLVYGHYRYQLKGHATDGEISIGQGWLRVRTAQ